VSPFIGRLDDIATKGMGIIDEICKIFFNYAFETEVIVASIRNPFMSSTRPSSAPTLHHTLQCPQTAHEPSLTDIGLEKFLKDWKIFRK